ncbi:MAG: hypothetical protein MUF62_05705 [Chitinophagaceae bacterium]|nr:hypothetical protein [Chitinophagaceae bacterium]
MGQKSRRYREQRRRAGRNRNRQGHHGAGKLQEPPWSWKATRMGYCCTRVLLRAKKFR